MKDVKVSTIKKLYDYEDDVFEPDDSWPEREPGESWEPQAGS